MTSPDTLRRYARQTILPEVGEAGQSQLAAARVLLVGVGGLGVPFAQYTAAAGIGQLTVVDGDVVQESNLHRQPLYGTRDIGRPKATAAAKRLAELNPTVALTAVDRWLDEGNALQLVASADLVVDASDNFATRYLLSDACVLAGKPLLQGSVSRFDGQLTMLVAGHAPCYRCLFPDVPSPGLVPSCAEAGVLGVVPGMIGMAMAAASINRILRIGAPLEGRLLLLDGLALSWTTVAVERRQECPACGREPRLSTLGDLGPYEAPWCADSAPTADEITPAAARQRMDEGWSPVLLDVREEWEWRIGRLDGAQLLPMSRVASEAGSLDPAREYLVYCHHGVRSAAVAEWLRDRQFRRVTNLAGGIDRWSVEVDPAIPRY